MERSKEDQVITNDLYESLGADLDDEDVQDLFYDCHEFLARLLDRSNPQWVQNDGIKLLQRLEEALDWYRVH